MSLDHRIHLVDVEIIHSKSEKVDLLGRLHSKDQYYHHKSYSDSAELSDVSSLLHICDVICGFSRSYRIEKVGRKSSL